MQDPALQRLVSSLDSVVEWAAATGETDAGLRDSLEVARLRLQCLSRRLGRPVEASPYLAFVSRLCTDRVNGMAVATGA